MPLTFVQDRKYHQDHRAAEQQLAVIFADGLHIKHHATTYSRECVLA